MLRKEIEADFFHFSFCRLVVPLPGPKFLDVQALTYSTSTTSGQLTQKTEPQYSSRTGDDMVASAPLRLLGNLADAPENPDPDVLQRSSAVPLQFLICDPQADIQL